MSDSRAVRSRSCVSVLFNEPKLLKCDNARRAVDRPGVSVLFNEPKLLKWWRLWFALFLTSVSVLFNEPKLLKSPQALEDTLVSLFVSVLFNEPKLLKSVWIAHPFWRSRLSFSALQRAEIAEIDALLTDLLVRATGFSALQRAEIAEMLMPMWVLREPQRFSALQRAEIAEMRRSATAPYGGALVSVLFNEPKLLKCASIAA